MKMRSCIVCVFVTVSLITRECKSFFVSHDALQAKQFIDTDTVKIENGIRLARPLRTINYNYETHTNLRAGNRKLQAGSHIVRLPRSGSHAGRRRILGGIKSVRCRLAASESAANIDVYAFSFSSRTLHFLCCFHGSSPSSSRAAHSS